MLDYSRGSEWRKWDLHIHSNASDGKGTPGEIVEKAIEQGLSVIALTDHHTVRNIDEIKRIGQDKGLSVISGIEFRTEYGSKSVHIIGLFPEEYNGTSLTQSALHDMILSPLGLSETHIISKGREKDSSLNESKAFKKGMFELQVDFKKASDLIREYGGIVTVHAGGKENGIDEEIQHYGTGVRNVLNIADSLGPLKEELLKDYVDFCEINTYSERDVNFYFETFGRCSIIASDAHKLNDVGAKFTWIKADPNIYGLKQASLESDRIFIGDIPYALERINKNKTKTLEKLNITWDSSYTGHSGEWFKDVEIVFNPEMTAVIGNKGSGKTAIAEITALLSNARNEDDFIFLQKDKFKKKKLASNFIANLSWFNGVAINTKNLNESVDLNSEELIHFVAQRSFEKFCNESDEGFVSEINSVVFSRMPEHERLGFPTFKELIDNQKSAINKQRSDFYIKINEINKKIKELEIQRDSNYKKSLQNSLKQLEIEITEHFKIKPEEVIPPEDLNTQEYKDLLTALKIVEEKIEIEKQNLEQFSQSHSKLSLINDNLHNFENKIKENIEEFIYDLKDFNIQLDNVFNYTIDYSKIAEAVGELISKIQASTQKLSEDPDRLGDLIIEKKSLKEKIDDYNKSNEGKLSKYQKYVIDSKEWNEKNNEICDKKDDLVIKIDYIGDFRTSKLIDDLNNLKTKRMEEVEKIFNSINAEVAIYNKFKAPITQFIESYKERMENYDIKINTGIYPKDDFINTFVDTYINNSVVSPFRGAEGLKAFRGIVDESDFETIDGVLNFLNKIQDIFDENPEECYHSIFKKEKYDSFVENFYSLKFLDARYSLQLYGKALNELSPGERGSLLLVFYLLLDARDIPLVLDQPEDNLDNESVAKILVPFIREAKKRRQIVIITHNANLAVVSDAEQVIRVKLDKKNNSKFSFVSGSLESKIIDDVVDVLEGTRNSFSVRNSKYNI